MYRPWSMKNISLGQPSVTSAVITQTVKEIKYRPDTNHCSYGDDIVIKNHCSYDGHIVIKNHRNYNIHIVIVVTIITQSL